MRSLSAFWLFLLLALPGLAFAQEQSPAIPKSEPSPQNSPTIGSALTQLRSEGEWLLGFSQRLDAMLLASETLVAGSSSSQTALKTQFELWTLDFSKRLSALHSRQTWLAVAAGAGWAVAIASVLWSVFR
jgi:hypothetical protein